MDVSVILATCGDRRWVDLAAGRSLPSIAAQTSPPAQIVLVHSATEALHEVRNRGAAMARHEWLCFVDADDELHHDYLAAMADASGDLRAPAVQYVLADHPDPEPVTLADRNIATMNPCVIGTLIRREMFLDAGGFWPWQAWEDWCLFRRCWLAGAEIVHVPPAVYRAHVTEGGRNAAASGNRRLYEQIIGRHRRWQKERAA